MMERTIQQKTIGTYQATIHFGLRKMPSEALISIDDVIAHIQQYQKEREKNSIYQTELNIQLSNMISADQDSPNLMIQFFNHPELNMMNNDIKAEAIGLAKNLMIEFNQARSIIICTDETIFLEEHIKIDTHTPNIVR